MPVYFNCRLFQAKNFSIIVINIEPGDTALFSILYCFTENLADKLVNLFRRNP
jgi:hypothetical protein